jgi:cytochrome c oxidase cbb3-type subunit III
MFDRNRTALPLLLLLVPSAFLYSQEPAVAGAGARAANDKSVTAAAVTGSKEDPAAFERGAALYAANCAGCHGVTARGGVGAPDLVRSLLVLDDEKGILIAPVIRNGRPDAGMPKMGLTEPQIADLVAWLHVQTYAAGHRTTYAFQDVLTGDAKKGQAYFSATCAGCHSATGDLKGIGARYDALALQARWLQPRGGRAAGGGGRGGRGGRGGGDTAPSTRGVTTATVSLPSGQKFSGTLDRVDDFSVSLRDSAGDYHSFTRDGAVPKVEIDDPLKPHTDLLAKYTDADVHNITAYLVTLK